MTTPEDAPGNDTSAAPEGVSGFVAKVLDQLSLSAWLPAALLATGLALITEFRTLETVDVARAVDGLASDKVRLLVIVLPVLIVATLITQAFSFESIRVLEGYWGHWWVISRLATVFIRWHQRQRRRLATRRADLSAAAFAAARPGMLSRGLSHTVVNALESMVLQVDLPPMTQEEREELSYLSWRNFCSPWRLARIDQLLAREAEYPAPHRLLPTRLGNLMRSTEDTLRNADGDVGSFGLRRRGLVSQRIQLQHDQFRTRLDMYCTMVFVSGFLAVLGPVVLGSAQMGVAGALTVTGFFGALACASYKAALASARGYCVILQQMDRA